MHSPKFDNEKDVANLRRTIDRLGIHHPVAHDAEFRIWREYTVRAWPSLVLIDPAGYVVAAASGEGHTAQFDEITAAVIAVFEERGALDRRPLETLVAERPEPETTLRFPGKVLADAALGRLFVADTHHHRVLVCGLDGVVHDAIGSGTPGYLDGPFDAARFDSPQGLALHGDALYIADRGTHTIRAVDLAARTVRTAAGTGRQGTWGGQGGAAHQTSLVSPWDLAVWEGLLFIAMAGVHQIWMLDLARGLVFPYAGSGQEARVDGPIDDAAFAQPSGLALRLATLAPGSSPASAPPDQLFVADAEANILRRIDLPPVNRVETLAGGNLFDFGDRDGRGDAVRLQHPLAVAVAGDRLFIADTYNHRIKVLTIPTGVVKTFAGTGRAGLADGPASRAQFSEPGGLSLADGVLYVADTNNHAVRRIDTVTGEVGTLIR